jgi:hypothetical protein
VHEHELGGFPTRVALHPQAPLRARKTSHRTLSAVAAVEIGNALGAVTPGERARGIMLAPRVGQWAPLLPLGGAGLTGIDFDPADARAAAADFPEWRFGTQLGAEVEVAHVAVAIGSLCDQPREERHRRLGALWRALRVGGRLVLIDRFLDGRGGLAIPAPSPKQLLVEIDELTAGHAVLAELQALRLSGDELTSTAMFSLLKIGRPERE